MLKEEIEDCTIFLTIAGSKAYGTDIPGSDIDIRGICVPKDKSYYVGMGLKKFEQQENGWVDDRVIYDLRKAINLMADANPNMLDFLFVDEKFWFKATPEWLKILEYREKFLSKRVRHSYGGYAFAQLKRIQRHRGYLMNPPKKKPERIDFGLPDKKVLNPEDLGTVQWLLADFLKNTVQYMNFSDQTKAELNEFGNFIGTVQGNMTGELSEAHWSVIQKIINASDEFITFMMKEKAYANALNDWYAYENWNKTRNDKRRMLEQKYNFDTKHAMHLVRLMRMGMEILKDGNCQVYRPDREELKYIRNGGWKYEEVVEYANVCEKKMDESLKTTKLPSNPDRVFLDKLCQNIVEEYVFNG